MEWEIEPINYSILGCIIDCLTYFDCSQHCRALGCYENFCGSGKML